MANRLARRGGGDETPRGQIDVLFEKINDADPDPDQNQSRPKHRFEHVQNRQPDKTCESAPR